MKEPAPGDAAARRERQLFADALQRPKPARAAFLQQACGDDATLRVRLERLLAAHDAASELPSALVVGSAAGATSTEPESLDGAVLGPYRVLEEIGSGGMAVVYLAEQSQPVKRRVALKVIKLGMDTREVLMRFESERQALALMSHPNIARIFDAGTTDRGRPYFVMEYVRGAPIRAFCDDHELDTRARVRLFVDVCHAVQHAHMKGVIHRDLKPSNILVTQEEERPVAKVIDFGVAKAINQRLSEQTLYTEIGRIIGTPEYMSPEQVDRGLEVDVDTRSDVYSLGVVLFELLTGTLPYDELTERGGGFAALQRAIREVDPPALASALRRAAADGTGAQIARARDTTLDVLVRTLRDELSWITLRALDKSPAHRYQSARELADDLERYLAGAAVVAGPPSGLYRMRKTFARHRIAISFAGTVAALLLSLIISTLVQSRRIALEAQRADRNATAAGEAARAAEAAAAAEREARKVAAAQAEAARIESRTSARIADFLFDLFRASRPGEPEHGDDLTARDLLDRGAARIRTELRDEPSVHASLLLEIGAAYDALGVYDRATPLLEEALAALEKLAPKDPRVAVTLWQLSQNYRKRGQFEAAQGVLRRLIAWREREQNPAELARALDGLGGVLSDSGRAAEAIPWFERAIHLRTEALGADSPELEVPWNNLGVAYFRTGDLDRAALAFEKVEAIYVRVPEQPDHAYLYTNLGTLQARLGRREQAEQTLRRALALVEKSFDAGHQLVGGVNLSLAQLYADWPGKDPALAEACFERVVANRRRNVPDHAILASALEEFGGFLFERGRFDRALELSREARDIFAQQAGKDSAAHAGADALEVRALVALQRLTPDLVARARTAVAVCESDNGDGQRLRTAWLALAEVLAATGDANGALAAQNKLAELAAGKAVGAGGKDGVRSEGR